MRVYVVLEQFTVPDDGDLDTELAAVHETREGAEENLVPELSAPGYRRERYIVEMETLP